MRRAFIVLTGALLAGGCAGRAPVEETQIERLRRAAERDLAVLESQLDSLRTERQRVMGRIVAVGERPTGQQVAAAPAAATLPAASETEDAAAAAGAEAVADVPVTTPEPGGGEQALSAEEIVILERRVFFAFDRSGLGPAARQAVQEKAEVLRSHPDLSVRLIGHTDRRGPDAYNQRLSERRAEAVRQALVQQGIEANRIETEGRGFHEPAAEGTGFEVHRQNRRVELVID